MGFLVTSATVPHVVHISNKRCATGSARRKLLFLSLLASLCGAASADCLREARYDAIILEALDHVSRMEYAAAESSLVRIPNDDAARPYFTGLVLMNRFQDLGDTAALRRAESIWGNLSAQSAHYSEDSAQARVYRGLATLQESYIAAIRGSQMRSGSLALTARGQLSPLSGIAEADAALALFDYYRQQVLKTIPFVHPDTRIPLQRLEAAADSSRYLRDMFRISAFWMLVDRKELDPALEISDEFLRRYPHNRMARQMRGSALFHQGRFSEARIVYEDLLSEYARLRDALPPNCLPVGYYCAVGNLARIYSGLGMKPEASARLAEWRKALDSGLSTWLPASLKKDLARL